MHAHVSKWGCEVQKYHSSGIIPPFTHGLTRHGSSHTTGMICSIMCTIALLHPHQMSGEQIATNPLKLQHHSRPCRFHRGTAGRRRRYRTGSHSILLACSHRRWAKVELQARRVATRLRDVLGQLGLTVTNRQASESSAERVAHDEDEGEQRKPSQFLVPSVPI